MKKAINNIIRSFLTLIFSISILSSYGQVVSISPENATAEDNNVVLTYDASKGNQALLGSNDIFIHTGVITNQSTSSNDWKYIIADWSSNLSKAIAVRVGTSNKYKINIGNIRSFYGVPSGVKILRLAMVFRNSNGSLVGKRGNIFDFDSDIYINVNAGSKWQVKNFNNQVNCLTNDLTGNVYAGTQDSVGNAYIELWNGKNWSKLGGNTNYLYPFVKLQGNSDLAAITTDLNGNVYASGRYLSNGRPDVAKWNGNSWSALLGTAAEFSASGAYNSINSMVVGNNGKVYVAGGDIRKFTPSSVPYYTIAEWDGNNWHELGGSMATMFNGIIKKIAFDAAGNLCAFGSFTNQSGNSYIAKWNGLTWGECGTNSIDINGNFIPEFAVDKSGNIYTNGINNNIGYIKKWNGVNWSIITNIGSLGSFSFIEDSSNIYSINETINSNFDKVVKKYDGVTFSELGGLNTPSPINGNITSLTGDINGNIYVAFNTLNDNSSVAKYFNNPKINSFIPLSAAKGETVTIYGKNFYGATKVNFGLDTSFSYTIVNDSTIIAVVGSGASGNVIVTNPGGNSSKSGFTFIPAPNIISVSPMKAPTGATVTIIGNNFNNVKFVKFGGTLSSITVVSDTLISAVIGSGSSGFVIIKTPGGVDSLAGFVFIPAPTITSFTPSSATVDQTVIIIGTNFTDATSVSFGGVAAKSFSVLTANTITAIIDNGNSGNVSVITPGGSASLSGFTFIPPPPSIKSFTPTYVSSGGTVTIKGKNFNGTNSVTFGGVVASSFTVINDTTINAIVGNGSTGNVSVTTPGGKDSLAGFIFNPYKLGIVELQNNQIQLYPNPAQESITIKSELNLNGKEYCIFDFVGKSVLKGKFLENITSVSVSELNNGIYILTISDSNNKLISTNKMSIIK